MSPALNGSSTLQHFESSNAVEIRNRTVSTRDCHIYYLAQYFLQYLVVIGGCVHLQAASLFVLHECYFHLECIW